jgi:hypothetical protein
MPRCGSRDPCSHSSPIRFLTRPARLWLIDELAAKWNRDVNTAMYFVLNVTVTRRQQHNVSKPHCQILGVELHCRFNRYLKRGASSREHHHQHAWERHRLLWLECGGHVTISSRQP